MKKRIGIIVTGLLLLLAGLPALAENSTVANGYTIHHNALTTDMLPKDVARAYHIQRSKSRGMLNVSIIKNIPGTTGQAVPAHVRVFAANLNGQTKTIPMREIREDNAIYYIGDFRINNEETLKFTIEVWLPGERKPYIAKLSQEFFTS
ncbi:MAG TPA: DUF4426 domain-containing protein [Chromatiaceae bacterium]|nr:DUF4426 domain-containing protein [Chromatiaceae bacterium]